MNEATQRLNTLAIESTQTMIDAAHAAQKQNAQLFQSWYETLEKTQHSNRQLAVTLLKQGQEMQQLWFEVFRESLRTATDTAVKTADAQMDRMARQANGAKRETAAAK